MAQSFLSPASAKTAEINSTMGDGTHGGLVSDGFYASLFYNDWVGETDKYLTHASKLGFLKSVSDASSINLQLAWRVLNPGFKPDFSYQDTVSPPGVFADWLDLQFAYQRKFSKNQSLQFELGVGHLGNHFAKSGHQQFHKAIDESFEHLTYKNSLKSWTGSAGAEILFQADISDALEIDFGVGTKIDYFYWQLFSQLTMDWQGLANIPVSFQVRLFHRLKDFQFDQAMKNSFEYSLKVKLFSFWVPSINYVSQQFKKDPVGQYYLDFASFVW